MIGQALRQSKPKKLHFTKGLFSRAINELDVKLDVMETNAPINEKEGNLDQAESERLTAKSIRAAIKELRAAKK